MIDSARTGIWISDDGQIGTPDPVNLYRFGGNNPVNRTDPSGLAWTEATAVTALNQQIDEWKKKGWKLAPRLLLHFAANTGTDYVLNEDQIAEIKPAVDDMAQRVLALEADGMSEGGSIDIRHQVRWTNTDWIMGPL